LNCVLHWRSRHVEKLGIALSISPNSAGIPHHAPADRNRSNLWNIPLIFGKLNNWHYTESNNTVTMISITVHWLMVDKNCGSKTSVLYILHILSLTRYARSLMYMLLHQISFLHHPVSLQNCTQNQYNRAFKDSTNIHTTKRTPCRNELTLSKSQTAVLSQRTNSVKLFLKLVPCIVHYCVQWPTNAH